MHKIKFLCLNLYVGLTDKQLDYEVFKLEVFFCVSFQEAINLNLIK